MPSAEEVAKGFMEVMEKEYELQMCMRGFSHLVKKHNGILEVMNTDIAAVEGDLSFEVKADRVVFMLGPIKED